MKLWYYKIIFDTEILFQWMYLVPTSQLLDWKEEQKYPSMSEGKKILLSFNSHLKIIFTILV